MSLLKQIHSSATTTSDATQLEEKGLLRITGNGREFQYVQADTALAKGNVVGPHSSVTAATNYKVSTDISECKPGIAAGIAMATISDEHFCYVQRRGRNTYVTTTNAVTAGSALWWSADLVARNNAAGAEHAVLGFARAADSGTVLAYANLNCPIVV